jgi:hypothetical protein
LQQQRQRGGTELLEQPDFRAQRRLQIVADVDQMIRRSQQRIGKQLGSELVLGTDVYVVALA